MRPKQSFLSTAPRFGAAALRKGFHRILRAAPIAAVIILLNSPAVPADEFIHDWSRRVGDTEGQVARSVAVDGAGNVVVTGEFSGTVDFGGGPLVSAGNADVFVAKFSSGGTHLWSLRFGDGDLQLGWSVAVDGSGNVVIAGSFWGTIDFGGGPLVSTGLVDVFVAKFSSGGTHLWSLRFGDGDFQYGRSVAVDGSGNVVVTGEFYGTVDFGGGPLVSAGYMDIYLAKLEPDGSHLWSRRFGDAETQWGTSVAVDGSGNIVVTGQFSGTVDFGGGPLVSAGGFDICLAKFSSGGTHLWSRRFGDTDSQWGGCVVFDCSGNVVITGNFYGIVDFGGGPLVSVDMDDIYLAKFNSGGVHLWSLGFGDLSDQEVGGVAVNGSGDIFLTGSFWNQVDFGGGPLVGAGHYDAYTAKFDPGGTHLCSERFGDASNGQYPRSIAVDGTDNAVIAGNFFGTVDFGGGPLVSEGSCDIFVARFSTSTPDEPLVRSIVDVGNDQGRRVLIRFQRSARDEPGSPAPVYRYDAFRRVDLIAAGTRQTAVGPWGSAAEQVRSVRTAGMGPDPAPLQPGWEFAGSVPAHAEQNYCMIAPTLADSTVDDGMHWSVFFIRAITSSPYTYFDSAPDSGYSLDNLSPAPPRGFAVTYETHGNRLEWLPSTEGDLWGYRVYRSIAEDFDPAPENLVHSTPGDEWVDAVAEGWRYHYRVTARDLAGNESGPSSPEAVTGAPGPGIPAAFELHPNVPNPFNPVTVIRYDVPPPGAVVTIRIFDVEGRRVRTLIEAEPSLGHGSVSWNGLNDGGEPVSSGVYFCRMTTNGFSMTRKVLLVR